MIYLKNLAKVAVLASTMIFMSACNIGIGSLGSGSNSTPSPIPTPAPTPTPIPNQWLQVGAAPPLTSNNLMYDGATNQLFMGLAYSDNVLCFISANATSNNDWDCSIQPPESLSSTTNYTTDGNGHIYIIGQQLQSINWNIYTYSTQRKSWSIQSINNGISDYSNMGWYYSNNYLYDGGSGINAATINLTTGNVGSYTPLPLAPSDFKVIATLNGVVYYRVSNASMIYKRDIQSSQTATQFGQSLNLEYIRSITSMGQNIYACGGASASDGNLYVNYLPIGSGVNAEWHKLPPISASEFSRDVIFQPACEDMTSGNGYVFVYNLYPDGVSGKFVVMKYKI